MMLVWIICAVLFFGLIAAVIKIYILKRSIAEIREGFSERGAEQKQLLKPERIQTVNISYGFRLMLQQ